MSKPRKLKKYHDEKNYNLITIEVVETQEKLVFDFTKLPKEIQEKLGPFALDHKLGDATAGAKDPKKIAPAINAVWKSLMEGKWTTRNPAEPKITKKDLANGIANLPKDQKDKAEKLLAAMGISL